MQKKSIIVVTTVFEITSPKGMEWVLESFIKGAGIPAKELQLLLNSGSGSIAIDVNRPDKDVDSQTVISLLPLKYDRSKSNDNPVKKEPASNEN